MLEEKAQGLLSAALRHVRDAERLLELAPYQSIDQAYHLAGFAPECARKAAIPARTYDLAIGHGVGHASELALDYALATNVSAHRYDLKDWRTRYPQLAAWKEIVRYEATGKRQASEVTALVKEAREIVDQMTYALWADGLIPGAFSW
jgi:hypothetical protein